MKLSPSVAVLTVLPVLVAGHADNVAAHHARHIDARQAPPSVQGLAATSGGNPPPVGTGTPAPIIAPGPVTSPAGAPPAAPAAPSSTVSLRSVNPTAVPLSSIVSNQPTFATQPLDSTAVPGATPTGVAGAPPLPNAAILAPAAYPALDVVPPIDSPEVQQWIMEVAATGIEIPDLSQTAPGGCPNNTGIINDQTRCWWTCGGCVRQTDITDCPTSLDWGLTYDDGPAFYTSNLLSFLDQQTPPLKSTFFVVGSRVISYPNILQTEYMGGHQIAVHTWSHPSLTQLTNDQIIAELGWSKKVIKDVLGVTPNMMRPPFGDIDDRVRAISLAMGLTPVIWSRISPLATFDTGDFNIHGGTITAEGVLQNWEDIIGNATTRSTGFIVLEHDLFEQTVEIATGYILPDALAHQPAFSIKPVITCLGQDMKNAYIETNDNSSHSPALSSAVGKGQVTLTNSAGAPVSTGGSATNTNGKSGSISTRLGSSGLAALTAVGGIVVSGALSLLA